MSVGPEIEDGNLLLAPNNGSEAVARTRHLLKDVEPSTQRSSARWVPWSQISEQLGVPFDATKITLSKLAQMRRDPMIAFALNFVKVPLIRAPWYIQSEDARVAGFVDNALREIYGRLILSLANSLEFGFSPVVKRFQLSNPKWIYFDKEAMKEVPVWDNNFAAITWKPFLALNPAQAWPSWNARGEFNGIRYSKSNTAFVFEEDEEPPEVPLDRALWMTNEKDSVFGSIYGYPRIGYAYRYWWSYWYRWALADRAFERWADPAFLVYHPAKVIDEEAGTETNYSSEALRVGEDIRSGATVAIPHTLITGSDDSMSSVKEWEIKALESEASFEALNESFEYLDTQKIRAVWVPEQSIAEGKGGSSSRNVAEVFGELLFESLAVVMSEVDYHINNFVIPQIVEHNFGPRGGDVVKITTGFNPQDIELMREIIRGFSNKDPASLQVDVRTLLERAGVPLLSPEQLRREAEETAKRTEIETPEPRPASRNGAGVTQDGLYYDPQEVIELSEHVFPGTKHFINPQIRVQTFALTRLWENEFRNLYSNFADYIENMGENLALADEKDESAAKRLVNRWRTSVKRLAVLTEKTLNIFKTVADTAARHELDTHRLDASTWAIDRPDVREWVDQHGAKLVKGVSATVRQELRTFLSSELKKTQTPKDIAQAIRTHFLHGENPWPTWKADRLARTEVARSYNGAALLSYKGAGIDLVRAHDGAGGFSGETDEECKERDGKTFSVADAFKLSENEHPRGTLAWSPVVLADDLNRVEDSDATES